MKVADYFSDPNQFHIVPEVRLAAEYLERHGEILFVNFNWGDAIDKAAEMMTVRMDEETDWTELRRIVRSTEIHGDWT